MKKIFISFFVFGLIFLSAGFANASSNWVNVGNPGFSAGQAWFSSLAINSNNIPYVAYRDYANNQKATVMKFDGTSWVPVGNAGFSAGQIQSPSLTIDSNGIPYVAYTDVANNSKATIMKFNGTSWVLVGNAGISGWIASTPSLAIDSNNIPYVAYTDVANNSKATVMKFNGTSWVLVGNAGFSAGSIYNRISLAIDSNNIPYVAYSQGGIGNKATAMKFDGTSWVLVGNAGFSAGTATSTTLAIDSNNILYVSYTDAANNQKATVMKFNDTSWVSVGNPGFSVAQAYSPSLALDSNNIPYVAYMDYSHNDEITAMKFDGTSWVLVGNAGFSTGISPCPSLAIDSNNIPYVVYTDSVNNFKATVMKYVSENPSLTITYPNGGETFTAGDTFTATWTSTGLQPTDVLYFGLVQEGTGAYFILTGSTPNDWSEIFTIPSNIKPGQYKMYARVPMTRTDDYSDNSFTINSLPTGDCTPTTTPWIKVLAPNGGETFTVGDTIKVFWKSCNIPSNYVWNIFVENTTAAAGYSVATNTDNDDFETFLAPSQSQWSFPFPPDPDFTYGPNFKILISAVNPPNNYPYYIDYSDNYFSIIPANPSLTITSPNGGETFTIGQQFAATWTSTGFQPTDKIYFGLFQDVTNAYYILTGETLNDGTEVFTIPSNIQPGQYRMYGRFNNTAIDDYSDSSFTVN